MFLHLKLLNRSIGSILILFGSLLRTKTCKSCFMMTSFLSIFFRSSMKPFLVIDATFWHFLDIYFIVHGSFSIVPNPSSLFQGHFQASFMASSRHLHGHFRGFFKPFFKGSSQTYPTSRFFSSFHLEFERGCYKYIRHISPI